MEEKIFFEKNNVLVSNSRFVVNGQTYAMNNITSVKSSVKRADPTAAVFVFIIGLSCLFGSGFIFLFGVILIIVGILAFMGAKDEYIVILNTSAGEEQALTSENKTYIKNIISALNEAIISRG